MTNPDTSTSGDNVGRDKFEGGTSVSGGVSGSGNAFGPRAEAHTHYHNYVDPKPTLLSWLSQHIENRITPSNLQELTECLLACSMCPANSLHDYGSIEALLQFLLQHEPKEDVKQQLLDTFERIFGYELPFAHLTTLVELVTQIELEIGTIHDIYRRSAPNGIRWGLPLIQEPKELLSYALYRLAQTNRQHDGTYPLLTFVSKLAGLLDRNDSTREAINQWLQKSAKTLEVEPMFLIPGSDGCIWQDDTNPVYLLILLEPRDHDHYAITAWFGPDQEQIYPATVEDEQVQLLEQMEHVIQRLHSQVVKGLAGELIIEIFLPVELLDHASDHWLLKQGKRSHFMLGEKYQLVTRSYDRLYDPDMETTHNDWRKRWQQWKAVVQGQSEATVCWFHSEQECPTNGLNPASPFLIFSFAPSAQFREELFWKLLDAGVPVALLPRKQMLSPTQMEEKLSALYHDGCHSLIKRIKSLRQEAVDEVRRQQNQQKLQEHFGHHLTLIWDDPDRLPPDGILY